MKTLIETYDVVVCGGGLAGVCAAVAAARRGAKTVLVQDRPVLGGNSSSEVRVTPHGAAAFHAYARETGILSELLVEERAVNHEPILENGWTNSVWDLALYDLVQRTPGLSLRLNTSVFAVVDGAGERVAQASLADLSRGYFHRPACAGDRRIAAVLARVAGAETELELRGRVFIDCTGDSLVADLAGCEWRMGSEGRAEFGEAHAPAEPSADTMGNSIHFRARDTGRPCPFTPPEWAVRHDNADFFYKQGRVPHEIRGGYWWLEIGMPWHTIHDAEAIRHELLRHTLGVWDWIKNKDPRTRERAANFALDWFGQVPGKRESRRVIGRYFMTERDPVERTVFPDEIGFGGWFIDLHTPGGLLAPTSEAASAEGYRPDSDYAIKSYAGPYGLPLRMLIAKDVDNLLLAGRNVSCSHAALGTVRVMATTALMGQAAGTAAAVALARGLELAEVPERAIREVQQVLLREGCFLPNVATDDRDDLARRARASASSEARLHGAGPESRGAHEGMSRWGDQSSRPEADALTHRRGQWIALGADRLDALELCLSNLADEPREVVAVLAPVDHIWDYRAEPGEPLARATLTVPAGARRAWVRWDLRLSGLAPGRYLRVDLLPNPEVAWHRAGRIEPGHVAAFEMGRGRMRRYGEGVTLAFRVEPPQPCFGAANVLSGVTRPHRFTNLWRSDPAESLDQWLRLDWPEPVEIATVDLTFAGHLLREYHAYEPLYRDPQCPRDYTLEARVGDEWRALLRVEGNHQRRRVHVLPERVWTDALRIVVHATNGDPSAAIYEVRCHG